MELLVFIAVCSHNFFCYCQIARDTLCVCKTNICITILRNGSFISCRCSYIAVLVGFCFFCGISNTSRKSRRCRALSVFQCECSHAVREVHIPKFSANCLIIKRYREMELLVFIAVRSSNFFCYCQAACFCFCIDIFNGIRWLFLIYLGHILIHYNSSSNLSRIFVFIYLPTSCSNNLFDPIICVFGFCNSIGCPFG